MGGGGEERRRGVLLQVGGVRGPEKGGMWVQ